MLFAGITYSTYIIFYYYLDLSYAKNRIDN